MSEINSKLEERDTSERFYRRLAIPSAMYSVVSVYLLFAGVKALFQNDTQYFDLHIVIGAMVGTVVYGFYCYRKFMQLDGIKSSGLGWRVKETRVKLPERKEHRRFG